MWSSWAGCRKKPEMILQSNGMSSKESVSLDTDGGVKVLSEKMGSDDNFQNASEDLKWFGYTRSAHPFLFHYLFLI